MPEGVNGHFPALLWVQAEQHRAGGNWEVVGGDFVFSSGPAHLAMRSSSSPWSGKQKSNLLLAETSLGFWLGAFQSLSG